MTHVVKAEIIGMRELAPDTFSIRLHAPAIAESALPGNFVMVRPSQPGQGWDPITPRPFSIYALLYEHGRPVGFSLIIKMLGRGSAAIRAHAPGDTLQCTGPLGNHIEFEPDRHYTMVAGGTGIAPVAFSAQQMERGGGRYTILYGGRGKGDVHLGELERLGLTALPATEDGSLGHHGLVTELMQMRLEHARPGQIVFACGPWAMMRAASAICTEMNVECLCSLERYMACGFGVCLACVYRKKDDDAYHTCCREGPVVVGAEVDWDA